MENKPIKLYTEEQVLKFINDNFDEGCSNLNELTSIKLPNETEIGEQAKFISTNWEFLRGYINGAKWVIEQILKQTNNYGTTNIKN